MDSISNNAGAGADLKKARRKISNRVDARPTIDRLPPHALDMEQGVLGCQLLSPNDCVGEVIEKLKGIGVEAHYDLRHQTIQAELFEMYDTRIPIDVITLQQRLKDKGLLDQVGGIAYLAQLQDAVPSAANLSYYLDIVQEKFLLRKMIHTCTDVVGRVYDYEGEVDALMDEVERDILAIRPKQTNQEAGMKELVHAAIGKIESKFLNGDKITGLETGLTDLDRLTDGLHPSEMLVIAALPSRGKTALAVNIAVRNALAGVPALILSAEMRPVQLVVRSICSESRVNFHHVTERDMPAMMSACTKLANAPLYIERASGFTISQCKAIARRHQQKNVIKLIVFDYQQRLVGEGENQEQRVASISRGVKDIAMELDVPVILLSQVNKDGETKHARATVEDADSLWKIENVGELDPTRQSVKLIVEKSRDGQTGYVMLEFFKQWTRFESASKVTD